MRNRELETIATILATTEDTYDDLESLDEEIVQRVWKYLVGCGIDPEDFRTKRASSKGFVVGQTLSVRSLGDWDCVFTFTVTKRSEKFVTLDWRGQVSRVAIRKWTDDVEYCYPLGTYSLAPLLRADAEVIQ